MTDNTPIDTPNKTSIPSGRKFVPPTIEQISEYGSDIRAGHACVFDADKFFDFYESKGWMVGKNKMKNWKAAVRNWKRGENHGTRDKQRTEGTVLPGYAQLDADGNYINT